MPNLCFGPLGRRVAPILSLVAWINCTAGQATLSGVEEGSATSGAPGTTTSDGAVTQDGNVLADVFPFEAQPAAVYVSKIKTLLSGLPADANEIALGETDTGLETLVDTWMQTSSYNDTLLSFFMLAFQTSLFDMQDIATQVPYGNHSNGGETWLLQQSIPRTALDLAVRGQPFTEIATTRRFMVTPQLLYFYALIDQFGDSKSETGDYFKQQNPNLTFEFMASGGGTTIADITNPNSPNFMKFNWPFLKQPANPSTCVPDTCMQNCGHVKITPDTFTYARGGNVWDILQGRGILYYVHGTYCNLQGISKYLIDDPGWTTWRAVTIRTPKPGESPTAIYDIAAFLKNDEIVMRIPRVGYFTSPAFLGQWPTNVNNQARSTINQTLIVGLDREFDGRDQTVPLDLRSLPTEHAAPNTACYGCHITMDPMRAYFTAELGYTFHPQLNPNLRELTGSWGQQGITATGGGLQQLGEQIAADPKFATAWVMKTCAWLNSAPCDARDPEVQRLAKDFAASGFKYNSMMRALLLSPLTTYKTKTLTASQRGTAATIARRDQLCRTLAARTGLADACDINDVSRLLNGFPRDGFSRGTTVLAQAREPSLVTRVVTENICSTLSLSAVDNRGPYSSQDPNACIANLVSKMMGLVPDQEPDTVAVLRGHFDGAKKLGASSTDAMRSTFVLACMSPHVITLGQ